MTGSSCCILKLEIVQVGLHMGDVDLTVAFAHDLGTRDDFWCLDSMVLQRVLGGTVGRGFSLCLCRCLHHLTDFVGGLGGLDSLELLLLLHFKAEIRADLACLALVDRLRVDHMLLLLMLVGEAGTCRVAVLLGSHAHVVKLGLLSSHVAIVTIEGAHGGLSTAMQSRRLWICNLDTSLLCGGQFLNEAVSRTCG